MIALALFGLLPAFSGVFAQNCTGAATFQYNNPHKLYDVLNGSSSASFLYYSENGAKLHMLALGDHVTKITVVGSNSLQEYQSTKLITVQSGYAFPECFNITVEIAPEYANPSATGNTVGVSLTDFAAFRDDRYTCSSVYGLSPNIEGSYTSSYNEINMFFGQTYKYFYYSAFKGEQFAFTASTEDYIGGAAQSLEVYVSRAFMNQKPSSRNFESWDLGGTSVTIVINATEDECYAFAVTAEKSTYFDVYVQGANPSACNVQYPRIQDNFNGSVSITDSAAAGTYRYFYYYSENKNLRIALEGNAELYVSSGSDAFPKNTTAQYMSNSTVGNSLEIAYANERCFSIGVFALDDSEFKLEINVDHPKRISLKVKLLAILLPIGIVLAAVALCLFVWRVQSLKKNHVLVVTNSEKSKLIEGETS